MNIKDLPENDRPRERMLQHGASVLSEAELLAILVGSGNTEETAVQLCQRVLSDYGNSLKELSRSSVADLVAKYKGFGLAKAITILAACELTNRRLKEEAKERRYITTSTDSYGYFRSFLQDIDHEECYVLFLNQDNSINGTPFLVSKGGITESSVDIRVILREALMRKATTLVLAHNHPSGNLRPSHADNELTDRLRKAAQLMHIRLLDHLIITASSYYSYHDNE